jgi:hypothetical protein
MPVVGKANNVQVKGNTPTPLLVLPALPGRVKVTVVNLGPASIVVGDIGLAAGSGFLLWAGEKLEQVTQSQLFALAGVTPNGGGQTAAVANLSVMVETVIG